MCFFQLSENKNILLKYFFKCVAFYAPYHVFRRVVSFNAVDWTVIMLVCVKNNR